VKEANGLVWILLGEGAQWAGLDITG
jgi:hypothetical protein